MASVKCSCGKVAQLSIHGNCACGKRSTFPYNSNPQENLEPSTARGIRRKTVGKKKAKAKK